MENDGGGWKLFAGILILLGGTMNVFDGLVGITQVNYVKRYTGGHASHHQQHQDMELGDPHHRC